MMPSGINGGLRFANPPYGLTEGFRADVLTRDEPDPYRHSGSRGDLSWDAHSL